LLHNADELRAVQFASKAKIVRNINGFWLANIKIDPRKARESQSGSPALCVVSFRPWEAAGV